jgi:phosphatidylglycerophosphate synthase
MRLKKDSRNGKSQIWWLLHSAFSLFFVPFLWVPAARRAASLGLAIFGLMSFAGLCFLYGRKSFRAADAVTLLRLFLGVSALLACLFLPAAPGGLGVFIALVVAELTDFFDGLIARRAGITPFGARWDMEVDAFFLMLLACIAVSFYRFPAWVLLIGGMRYVFAFLFLPLGEMATAPSVFRWSAKVISAYSAGSLIGVTFPYVGWNAKVFAALAALALLSLSFGWETALRLKGR